MENANKIPVTEDEDEDIEALRLAALQSLKKKNAQNDAVINAGFLPGSDFHENSRFGHKNLRLHPKKRGRFFNHRGGKNGQFNNQQFHNRARSSNLIAITPISNDPDVIERKEPPKSPKLTLPQDRYCGKLEQVEKPTETDKFNRYNNSDASDEDSEDEDALLESEEEKGELKRSDSLEALMQELDDEIQGKPKAKEEKITEKPVKVKNRKKIKKISTSESPAETSDSAVEVPQKNEAIPEVKPETTVSSPVHNKKPVQVEKDQESSPPKKFRRSFANKPKPWSFPNQNFVQNPPFIPPIYPPVPPIIPVIPPVFNPPIQPPPFFERPLSPLAINTETLTTQTLAPLSPRSAAFVLENRAIIEKRKRRSYSRSPSPRLRRSSSPRGPRRSLSPRRKSRSPKRRSLSPRRRSNSPKRPKKANLVSPKAKPNVRERLGVKTSGKAEEEKKEVKVEVKKEEKQLDPVLEARRRKFESKEIKVKEGVIRLKPKEETVAKTEEKIEETVSQPQENKEDESLDEDKLLEDEDFELDTKEPDLYSDEESGSENEGRFKTKQNSGVKPPVLSFSKLVNGVKTKIKDAPLPDSSTKSRQRNRNRLSRRNKSPKRKEEKKKEEPKARARIVVKSERHPTTIEKRFERKIEIKIKNPAKYEKGEKKKEKEEDIEEKTQRKVEVGNRSEDDEDMEIVVENDSGEENANKNEGDLRAQLSKKRAEKLQKILPVDSVPSRLLQNALQGAVFKKPKKSKRKELTNSEGKLPIHMRLGIASNVETKPKRKSRKRKNKSNEEQV